MTAAHGVMCLACRCIHAGVLQLLGRRVVHIVSDNVSGMAEIHHLLYIYAHAAQHIEQNLSVHPLKA